MNQENNNQIFDISSEAFADLAQSWIEDRKGIRTKIIDVRGSASYADFL